ncbi:MAG: exodeoxyribonuclease III [Parvibaculaceae bacterium]
MQIATWNVNSVKARMETVLGWLREAKPDIALLQEIKCEDQNFPRLEFEALGYNLALHGQKSYNGVAILSKRPFDEVTMRLPGDESDQQSRYVEAAVGGVRVASIYLPNGNPPSTDKYAYKLAFMERLREHARGLLAYEEAFVLGGDYNVIPAPIDAKNPEAWVNDALFLPETRQRFRELIHLGLTEALRALHPEPGLYTFWDYQAGAWQKNNGIRIDHLLLSPQASDRLKGVRIDKHVRGWEKPSDHVPVVVELAD